MTYPEDDDDADLSNSEYHNESELDDADDAGEDDETSTDTTACPHCGHPVYEDAEKCPHCGHYISPHASTNRKPLWIIVGVILALLVILIWAMR
jgi:RNA polymerase subunit RPABC4/transcription elongation factor Spt4